MNLKRSSYHRCSYHILICIISHLWSGIGGESIPGLSINVPHHVTVQRGLCVHIPCRFTVPRTENLTTNAKGLWYNTSGHIVASNSKSNNQFLSNGRFSLVGDVRRGDCSLYIEDPLHEDQGHYHFRVEDNIKFTYRDIQPYVEVTDLTDKPEISPITSWIHGEEVTLTCTAPGRCKRIIPQIIWEGNIQNTRVETRTSDHENGTKTHSSTITFTAKKEQNNSILSCIVQLRGGLTTAQQITITIEYPPRAPEIQCSIISKDQSNCAMDADNTIYSLEGSQLSLTCSADSVPESSMVWKSSNQTQSSSSMDKLTFTDLSLNDEGSYTCQATNAHGTMETSVTIRVTFQPPQTDSEMEPYCKATENHIHCACIVQTFLGASFRWKIDDKFYDRSESNINISTCKSDFVTISMLSLHLPQKEIPYIKCISSNKFGDLVLDLLNKKCSMDYQVILGIVTGNIVILFLIAFGVFWFMKRHMKKKQGNDDMYELSDAKGPESVYQDLQRPTDSIYNIITRSQQ